MTIKYKSYNYYLKHHYRQTWNEFILELNDLFDKVFRLENIDFGLFSSAKDIDILFDAVLTPGSPFYDDAPRTRRPSQLFTQGGLNKGELLDGFMIQKLNDLLGVNFMYIPFVLSVIHKPIMLITQQIHNITQKTAVKDLFQDSKVYLLRLY